MLTLNNKLITAGALLLISIITGIWLSHIGRPLNTMIFTIHKLIALAGAIFLVIALYNPFKTASDGPVIMILTALAALFLLTLFVTGGVLSSEKSLPGFVLLLHKISPAVMILALSGVIYLLIQKSSAF